MNTSNPLNGDQTMHSNIARNFELRKMIFSLHERVTIESRLRNIRMNKSDVKILNEMGKCNEFADFNDDDLYYVYLVLKHSNINTSEQIKEHIDLIENKLIEFTEPN